MGWWKLISRGRCVKWCCCFCFLLCKVWGTWLGSCFARVYTRTHSQSFSFFAVTSVTERSAKLFFLQHLLYETAPEFERENCLVRGAEMMKFCVANSCFYIPLSKNVSSRVVFPWNIMRYLCGVTLVTAKKTKSLYCVRTRAREGRVLRYADWSIRKELLSEESQFHFSIKNNALRLFLFNRRVVLWKVTCRFWENNVSFWGKQRVVFLQLTCRFAWKNSRCDFAGYYYGRITALYFQNQCVKRLSVFHRF